MLPRPNGFTRAAGTAVRTDGVDPYLWDRRIVERVNALAGRRRGLLRLGVVALLLLAAFFAALPWLGCVTSGDRLLIDPPPDIRTMLRPCTFGSDIIFGPPRGTPGFGGPYWGNVIVGIVYVTAALFATFTKRSP